MKEKPGMFAAKQTTIDPKQFAEMLGMPYSSLLMLMKEHHERDPIVKTSIHEHVSFIKVQEGYPIFFFIEQSRSKTKSKLQRWEKKSLFWTSTRVLLLSLKFFSFATILVMRFMRYIGRIMG